MSCHQLFVLLCHSQQAVPALPQQLHSQRRLPGTRHARFLHPSSQTSSERAQELPTVPIFVTEKVHVGIERNRAIPTKWRTGSSRRCVGGSRHMVDSHFPGERSSSQRSDSGLRDDRTFRRREPYCECSVRSRPVVATFSYPGLRPVARTYIA